MLVEHAIARRQTKDRQTETGAQHFRKTSTKHEIAIRQITAEVKKMDCELVTGKNYVVVVP